MKLEEMTWEELTNSWNIGYQYWLIYKSDEARINIDAIHKEQTRRCLEAFHNKEVAK